MIALKRKVVVQTIVYSKLYWFNAKKASCSISPQLSLAKISENFHKINFIKEELHKRKEKSEVLLIAISCLLFCAYIRLKFNFNSISFQNLSSHLFPDLSFLLLNKFSPFFSVIIIDFLFFCISISFTSFWILPKHRSTKIPQKLGEINFIKENKNQVFLILSEL